MKNILLLNKTKFINAIYFDIIKYYILIILFTKKITMIILFNKNIK